MNSAAKNIIVITAITVIAGALLGYVNEVTKAPIAEQETLSKQKAYQSVFASASNFEEYTDMTTEDLDSYLAQNGLDKESTTEVLVAKDQSGEMLGYVLGVVTHEGYGGDIAVYVGITSDGTVSGVDILSISETAGLGMKATNPEFLEQFAGKNVSRFSYTKTGKTADYEIDALSGATITSNAMTNAVNAALLCFERIGGGN